MDESYIPEGELYGPEGEPFDPNKVPRRKKQLPQWFVEEKGREEAPQKPGLTDRSKRKLRRLRRRRAERWIRDNCRIS